MPKYEVNKLDIKDCQRETVVCFVDFLASLVAIRVLLSSV